MLNGNERIIRHKVGLLNLAGMSPLPVVEYFDVLSNLGDRLLPGAIFPVMNQFRFERAEEALHREIGSGLKE